MRPAMWYLSHGMSVAETGLDDGLLLQTEEVGLAIALLELPSLSYGKKAAFERINKIMKKSELLMTKAHGESLSLLLFVRSNR